MKTAGVTAFLAFVLIGIGAAVAGQSTASLSIPAHHLSSKQLRLLTEAARTAQDHRELARYFHQEAQRMRAQEQYHMEIAAFYRLRPVPKPLVSMVEHCKYLADKSRDAAIADDQSAILQEQIAEQIDHGEQPNSAALLNASSPGVAAPQEVTGVVTDDLCKRTHMFPGHSDADCARVCVSAGSKYALVAGDKVYVLKGDPKLIEQFAGEKVTVNGDAKKGSMSVQVISEVK